MDVASPPDLSPDAPRVLVVAADPLVRRALVAAVRGRFEHATLDAAAALAAAPAAASADAVLWDLGADALTVVDRFTATSPPDAPVVALVPSAALARDALAWGARGVIPRDADDGALAASVRAVSHGLTALSPSFVDALLAPDVAEAPAASPTGEGLTARELEVLGLVAEGMPNKLIAAQLGISEHTVKFHVNAVMARLGAQSRTEAVVRAARRGLLVL